MANAVATEKVKNGKAQPADTKPVEAMSASIHRIQRKQADQLKKSEKRKQRAEKKIREALVTGDTRPRTKAGRLAKETGKKAVRMRPGGLTHIQMMIDHHEEFSGMSNDAIAGRVGCSVSSVRRVKTELRKQGYYPLTIAQRVQAVLKEKETKKE